MIGIEELELNSLLYTGAFAPVFPGCGKQGMALYICAGCSRSYGCCIYRQNCRGYKRGKKA